MGKKKQSYLASSGFSGFGFSDGVLKGVVKKGYNNPTPIQRKCIPIIMDGKDVVAMARTGSGKTACFLLPILHHLREHDNCSGPRALILSPTRELALQTYQFFKELAKYTGLRASVVIGGSSIDKNFEALHSQPDVIIATPGRLTHVLMEMELKLANIKYFVLDEADRLFELGFCDQIKLISKQIGVERQTLLFSATLPQTLTEFTRIGLHDPVLIRLDKDEKLSEFLKLNYINVRSVQKIPLLLYLLCEKLHNKDKTAVFLPTRHYVEYVHELLTGLNVESTFIYSSLDQEARSENISKFSNRARVCNILLVTDIAARGIDIPVLDNVINFNFPCSPKLFVHRVGRVARSGRSGTAISFVTSEELAYYVDVQLFLGRPISLADKDSSEDEDGILGGVNKETVADYFDKINTIASLEGADYESLRETADRSLIQYAKTCPAACHESSKRAKDLNLENLQIHPFLRLKSTDTNVQDFLNSIKNYKSSKTIFEVNPTKNMNAFQVMQETRKRHGESIEDFSAKKARKEAENSKHAQQKVADGFIPYNSTNQHFEKGLEISQFEKEIRSSAFDVIVDDEKKLAEKRSQKVWDRKQKRYKGISENNKKITTESGAKISASFKTGRYEHWLKNKGNAKSGDRNFEDFVKSTQAENKHNKGRNELKNADQVAKVRRQKARKMEFDKRRYQEKKSRHENKSGKGGQKFKGKGKKKK
ncbi:ATP-dependent RNA helicase DDX54-like [Convolutriloba macropyga]|uniref:ATP-dependent RNA helicase DDX54-like n=1 Tax=Convolutriloba macropyga TaxID=536237 RepID=UPI003F5247F3